MDGNPETNIRLSPELAACVDQWEQKLHYLLEERYDGERQITINFSPDMPACVCLEGTEELLPEFHDELVRRLAEKGWKSPSVRLARYMPHGRLHAEVILGS